MIQRLLILVFATAILLLSSARALAQTDTIESPMSMLHSVYAQLDPQHMPHGLLFQSAYPMATLPHYTGGGVERMIHFGWTSIPTGEYSSH